MLARRTPILILGIAIASLIALYVTHTLSYPAIMVHRQIQSLRDCTFGSTNFKTDDYGFSFSVPDGYCVLPNRLFPADGSIEIVPKNFYFSFNEYARGTVAAASNVSVLFEHTTPTRDPQHILAILMYGKFVSAEHITSTTTPSGIPITLANSVLGTDNALYDWAIATNRSNTQFVLMIIKHDSEHTVRDYIVNHFSETPPVLAQ